MAFQSLVRALAQAPYTQELKQRWASQPLILRGVARLAKGILVSALAQGQNILVVTPTLEEGGRWAAQLESMGWDKVLFYPTSEASPYETYDPDQEMIWGQMQVLADLLFYSGSLAVVATERALQPHLPPVGVFAAHCFALRTHQSMSLKELAHQLAALGYEKVPLVETEGQWSQRGDLVDLFPVANELPVRLEFFGEEIEKIREFDPASQRSQDPVTEVILTPTSFAPVIREGLLACADDLPASLQDQLVAEAPLPGIRRFLGVAFAEPVSLAAYCEKSILIWDEPEQCLAHNQQWFNHAEDHWQQTQTQEPFLRPLHRPLEAIQSTLPHRYLCISELSGPGIHLNSRAVPAIPHQFAALAKTLKQERNQGSQVWIYSAQPSRSVALLQEHDCPVQFVPNPRDFPTLDRLCSSQTPIALKYSGLAECEGFILPVYRTVVVTDREFFGQHSLVTPHYTRKRRQAASRQVDPHLLKAGDFVVHKHHGIARYLGLESLTIAGETREYFVIEFKDGLIRVPADQANILSRYRATSDTPPELNKMTGSAWEKTKNKVRKALQKVAYDLLELYAKRAQQTGIPFPPDTPWQQEMEESFPYTLTPDQAKCVQEVKLDMELPRPMDRLVCGDVGFGKTEVAVRAIFKAVMAGKQVAFLAPTTILSQQHYHTLKERFAPYPIEVGLLNRFRSPEERRDLIQRLKKGELDIVVGTHQLLGKSVEFRDLGLLVIDEEQRFGVNQKEKIKALKTHVDVLTLSATPIPRTLYMALSGVREMSLITTPPPSRRPIKTYLAPYQEESVYTAIRQELDRGGQVFYVVNRVENIEAVAARLHQLIPGSRIAIAHGQMPEGELEATMLSFHNGEADILVCTTIIESGLDIPRVNTIIVEQAELFGLSQLYQLRGRVGRSGVQAYAWLFYPPNKVLSEEARQRLRAIQEFSQLGSGYQLAMRDMEIRGVGNLLGTEQSGQVNAIGFDLYMEMLQEAIQQIRGQEIPAVDDTQIDLAVTAMIPQSYIPDPDQKLQAYRQVASAASVMDLQLIQAEWQDRYGAVPKPAQALFRLVELKILARSLGFSRIRPAQEHLILETPMAEPAWQRLKDGIPTHLQSRFVYQPGKVTVRGMGHMAPHLQLAHLIEWFSKMVNALTHRSLSPA